MAAARWIAAAATPPSSSGTVDEEGERCGPQWTSLFAAMDYVQVSPQFGGSAILCEVPARLGGSDCVLTCAPTALLGPSFYLPCLPHTHRVVCRTHKGRR